MNTIFLAAALSLGISVPDGEDISTTEVVQLDFEYKQFYVFAGYEEPALKIVGQEMGDIELFGYGLGYRLPVTERFYLDMSVGYYDVSVDSSSDGYNEAIFTTFKNIHGQPRFRPDTFDYAVDKEYGVNLGAHYMISDRWAVWGKLRYLRPREFFRMWDSDGDFRFLEEGRPDCNCLWHHKNTLDLNAAQVGIRFVW